MVAAATEASALAVIAAALATALATGLGAVPVALVTRVSRSWLGFANAAAGAFMLAASGMLFYEGGAWSPSKTAIGAVIGMVSIALAARWLRSRQHFRFEALRGMDARVALIIVAVMTVHSVAEGVGVGVAFGGGDSLGFATAFAIAVHNIPEGLAISLVLVPRGVTIFRAAGWSVVSSLPQPLLALPAFVFVELFEQALSVGLGFAGGAMTWMVIAQIVPDALRSFRAERKAIAFR